MLSPRPPIPWPTWPGTSIASRPRTCTARQPASSVPAWRPCAARSTASRPRPPAPWRPSTAPGPTPPTAPSPPPPGSATTATSGGAASNQVQLARRLSELPQARRAFAAGQVSLTHLSLLARTAGQVGLEPVQEQEEVLVEAARSLDPRMFGQVCDHLRHCVDADGALADANRAHELRAVWLSQTMDGVWDLRGTLDAEGGAIPQAALAAVEGKPQPDDQRTAPQRRHDTLVELGRRRLDAGDLPTSGGQRPHLVVSVDLDTLAGSRPGGC